MATLGDILGAARRSASGIERWLQAEDSQLARRVGQAAQEAGVSMGGYARMAVAGFSQYATEDDWARLTRVLSESYDPGSDCLAFMLRWNLDRQVAVT